MTRQKPARPALLNDAETIWFRDDAPRTTAPAPPARTLAALPSSGIWLEPTVLIVRHAAEEARVPLAEIEEVELDVHVRLAAIALLLGGTVAASAAALFGFGVRHVDLVLVPLAVAFVLLRRVSLRGTLELALRGGGTRSLPLANADLRRLQRAGRCGPSFVAAVQEAASHARSGRG